MAQASYVLRKTVHEMIQVVVRALTDKEQMSGRYSLLLRPSCSAVFRSVTGSRAPNMEPQTQAPGFGLVSLPVRPPMRCSYACNCLTIFSFIALEVLCVI